MLSLKDIYEKELEKIINDRKNIAVFLVGSSKYIDFNKENCNINDIDLFIISNQCENQIREIKSIDSIEFDLNYFSKYYVEKLIKNKEYFFIKEMKDAKVIYDKDSISEELIIKSHKRYNEGPDNISSHINSIEIYENISRLKNKENYSKSEYEFLTNIYLKDIIREYFNINKKWIPKDKKLFTYLKEKDENLFKLVEKVHEIYDYKRLEDVYKYVFKVNDKLY